MTDVETIFDSYPGPIPFKPKKGNQVDEAIYAVVKREKIALPIIPIKNNLYLIGSNRVNCENKFGNVMVKIGGGSQKLEEYLEKNGYQMEIQLKDHMFKSKKPLTWICDQLVQGKKIPKAEVQAFYSSKPGSKSPKRQNISPTRQSSKNLINNEYYGVVSQSSPSRK